MTELSSGDLLPLPAGQVGVARIPVVGTDGNTYYTTLEAVGSLAPPSTVPGPAPQFTPTTQTLPPGTPASVTISGTSPALGIQFGVPQGDPGPPGQEAALNVDIIDSDYALVQADDGRVKLAANPIIITAPAPGTLTNGTKVMIKNMSGGAVVMAGMNNAFGATRLLNDGMATVWCFTGPNGSSVSWTGDVVQ